MGDTDACSTTLSWLSEQITSSPATPAISITTSAPSLEEQLDEVLSDKGAGDQVLDAHAATEDKRESPQTPSQVVVEEGVADQATPTRQSSQVAASPGASSVKPASSPMPVKPATSPAASSVVASSADKKQIKAAPVVTDLTSRLRNGIVIDGATKMPVNNKDMLYAKVDLISWVESTINIDDADALDEQKKQFKMFLGMVAQLTTGVNSAAKKLRSYIDNMTRAAERNKKSKDKAHERQVATKLKEDAKNAAARVKQAATDASPIFSIQSQQFEQFGVKAMAVETKDTVGREAPKSHAVPFKLELLDVFSSSWTGKPRVQLALSAFGGEYKKSKTTQVEGRGQQPMSSKQGKEETDHMFTEAFKIAGIPLNLEVLKDTPAASIVSNTWMFGYMPGRNSAALTNQGLPLMKVFVHGEVDAFACDLQALTVAWGKLENMEELSAQTMQECLLSLCGEKLKRLADHGCVFHAVKIEGGSAIYVPTGWVLVERAVPKATLTYGARKTVFVKDGVHATSYDAVIEHLRAAGNNVARYEEVRAAMS